ncbi:MAG TPA: hypothetical protein VF297_05060 [Pyrinomonadaceae bacterium]
MSDQVLIESELIRLSTALDEASQEYMVLCRVAAEKRDAYELAKAKAMLKATGSNADTRRAEVVSICADLMTASHIAEAQRDGMKERLRALSDVLNALQTRAAFVREEMKLAGRFN